LIQQKCAYNNFVTGSKKLKTHQFFSFFLIGIKYRQTGPLYFFIKVSSDFEQKFIKK